MAGQMVCCLSWLGTVSELRGTCNTGDGPKDFFFKCIFYVRFISSIMPKHCYVAKISLHTNKHITNDHVYVLFVILDQSCFFPNGLFLFSCFFHNLHFKEYHWSSSVGYNYS